MMWWNKKGYVIIICNNEKLEIVGKRLNYINPLDIIQPLRYLKAYLIALGIAWNKKWEWIHKKNTKIFIIWSKFFDILQIFYEHVVYLK